MVFESYSIPDRSQAARGVADPVLPLLSLVIPTLNEVANLEPLLKRLQSVLSPIPHEVLIVDDSSVDGTAARATELSQAFSSVRVIRRRAPRGLSASILDGFRAARGDVVAVMDADLQHDETRLPVMLEALRTHDLAIGSRYTEAGRTEDWSRVRETQSRWATRATRAVLGIRVSDPLSGFFALRRSLFRRIEGDLRPRGWKLLVDILAATGTCRVAEVPFVFRLRHAGRSKLGAKVVLAWFGQLVALWSLSRRSRRRASVTNRRGPTVVEATT